MTHATAIKIIKFKTHYTVYFSHDTMACLFTCSLLLEIVHLVDYIQHRLAALYDKNN